MGVLWLFSAKRARVGLGIRMFAQNCPIDGLTCDFSVAQERFETVRSRAPGLQADYLVQVPSDWAVA